MQQIKAYSAEKKMRVGFIGRGVLGLNVLRALFENDRVDVRFVIACEPTENVPQGTDGLKGLAVANQVPFFEENNINNSNYVTLFIEERLDLVVAMLWLNTIEQRVIDACKIGVLNLHGGDLPRYRGNACQAWAILNQESEIGVTCHLMRGDHLDSGPICRKEIIPIGEEDTVTDLIAKIDEIGETLVLSSIEDFLNCTIKLTDQDDLQALHCFPRLPRDGEINWSMPRADILRLIRAANRPYPGAYTYYRDHIGHGEIKKIVIYSAKAYDNFIGQFNAVAGHVVQIEKEQKCGVVCGDNRILALTEVECQGEKINPWLVIRSVRQRLGLDLHTEIRDIWDEIQGASNHFSKHESGVDLNEFSANFANNVAFKLEEYIEQIEKSVKTLGEMLNRAGLEASENELRNYSFCKRFYDWEQRSRWFGIQVYQSIKVRGRSSSFNVGYWYWADNEHALHQRLYVGVDQKTKSPYRLEMTRIFETIMQSKVFISEGVDGQHGTGMYVSVPIGSRARNAKLLRDFSAVASEI